MQQEATSKILTVPNLLSLIRLLLLPVFFVVLVHYEKNVVAFIILLVASLTDLIDGFVARVTNSVTVFGQWLDPFVDRIFILSVVIAVFIVGRVPLWILCVLFVRDACMLVLTIYQRRRFNREFRVVFIGKLTTALLMAGFCSLVLLWPMLPGVGIVELPFLPGWGANSTPLGSWLLYFGVVFSLMAACVYLYQGTRPNKDDHPAMVLESEEIPQTYSVEDSSLSKRPLKNYLFQGEEQEAPERTGRNEPSGN